MSRLLITHSSQLELPVWTIPMGLAGSAAGVWALWHDLVPDLIIKFVLLLILVGVVPLLSRVYGYRRIDLYDG